MCKDHKMVLSKLKLTFENVSEDKEYLHEQLVNSKRVNKELLHELD